ncbi:MAG TPA: M1 family aminopeptidase [Polyangia bacterium]|jgi:aminopeptidase N
MRAALVAAVVALLAACAAPRGRPPPAAAPAPPIQMPRGYDALSYTLDLSLVDPDGPFDGALALELVARRAGLGEIDLDSVDLEILAVTERGAPRRFAVASEHLRITLEPPAADGETRALAIRYRARLSKGLQRWGDHLYSAYHTRAWMPCNFDPGDKARFDLTLAVPPGWTVLASGTPAGAERRRWTLDVPHSTYLFGFTAGVFATSSRAAEGGLPQLEALASAETPPAIAARLLDETPGMIRFFAEVSGVPFPGPRYGVAFVGEGTAQEMASWSALGREFAATWNADPKEDWLAAHELAHQWWGNAATCPTWGDFWIQEAFAVFMTAAYKERRWGRAAYDRERERNRARYEAFRATGGDHALALGPDTPSGALGRQLVYGKGPRVLYVLRDELGEPAFWSAVRAFTQAAVRDGSRTTELRRAFERAAGRPLPIFDRAVYGAGAP